MGLESPSTVLLSGEAAECQRMARAMVASMCDSPGALDRLEEIRRVVGDKAKSALGRLRSAQTTQTDDMLWAQQLIEQSYNKVNSIQGSMSKIVAMCDQTNEQLAQAYTNIRRVGIARRHLRTTTRLLDLFVSIPERARQLEVQVQEDDGAVKRVYVQVRQLVRLRDKALAETSKYQKGNDTGVHARVSRHFDSLKVVIAAIEKRIWENIRDTFYLAEEDPATLVKTLEIVEMEDYEESRGYPTTLFRSNKQPPVSMMQRTLNILDESIGKRFATAFGDESESSASIDKVLKVGSDLINDLDFVANHVVHCFPERFEIFNLYESRYQKFLYAKLSDATADADRMSPSDILNCIHWIQEYRESMDALGVDTESESSSSAMLLEHVPTLMQAYLTSVRQTMSDWAQKIMQTDWRSEPSEDNGRWSTSAPQDLFVILNQQIDLAVKREIKGQPFLDIVTMCLSVLGDYQALLISALNAQGADRPDNYLCAILSNCQQCSENCEAMRDRCREQLEPEMEEILEEKTDDAINGFIRVGTVAVNVLASQMVACIKEKVLPEMFVPRWLSARDGEVGDKIVATLSDYFSDYETWIGNDFFFSRLIQEAIRLLVKAYCDALLASTLNLKKNKDDVIAKLHADYELLFSWYTSPNVSEYVPEQVAQKQIEHIEKIQNILESDKDWIPLFFESVFEVYGADKGAALKTLLQMRADMSSSEISQVCEKYRDKYSSQAQSSNSQAVSADQVSAARSGATKKGFLNSIWN
ncbi:unnamed protein product (mitochondrion) [Plasmodiophora brassicae]|uniref:Uncharacterized protein n=1 Tax=Plasmodiophora brassicae TaxID=37360 RepID=A0A0G4IN25_PLABS|nr:hypothetical protein PBRA_005292 [Plasmodiophora brassicae]SPQ95351.1 unnamed protein product [Plasmodiophora brassicae]